MKCFLILISAWISMCSAKIEPASMDNFNATQDAVRLKIAYDEEGKEYIARLFPKRSHEQRVQIAEAYKKLYNKDIFDPLAGLSFAGLLWYNIKGDDFGHLIHAMVTPLPALYGHDIFQDNKPDFSSSDALLDAIASLSNIEWRDVRDYRDRNFWGKSFYFNYVKKPNDHFDVMVADISNGKRSESEKIDNAAAIADAKYLYKICGTVSRGNDWVKDEHDVRDLFVTRSFKHINQITLEYEKLYHHSLLSDINQHIFEEYDLKEAIKTIIRSSNSISTYFAERLHDILSATNTNEMALNRIIVARSEIDMEVIKDTFWKKYQRTLGSMIDAETSGEYKKLLMDIIAK